LLPALSTAIKARSLKLAGTANAFNNVFSKNSAVEANF
jgi:hypothetical protein